MLVDDDPKALEKLEKVLTAAAGWHFRAALTGGEALDVVTQERPQIVMVKEDLPDLPGQHGRAHREVERARRGDAALHAARQQRAPGRGEAGRRERHDEH